MSPTHCSSDLCSTIKNNRLIMAKNLQMLLVHLYIYICTSMIVEMIHPMCLVWSGRVCTPWFIIVGAKL